jgi:hypothetical protein
MNKAFTIALSAIAMTQARSLRGLAADEAAPLRINTAYYMQSNKGGKDLGELRKLGVNGLNVPFYNPADLVDGKITGWKDSGAVVDDALVGLVKDWQSALGSEPGVFMLTFGGVTLDSDLWGAAFADPAKFGKATAKMLKDLQTKAGVKSLKVGIDLDLEEVEDKHGEILSKGMGGFLAALHADCPRSQCPVQVDVLSLFWKDWNPEWQRAMVLNNGPSTTNGFDYLGLMVAAEPASGQTMMNYWGGDDAGKHGVWPAALSAAVPLNTRVVNFWGAGAMDGEPQTDKFATAPGALFAWIKTSNVNVAWWVWNPTAAKGGSEAGYNNMAALQAGAGF